MSRFHSYINNALAILNQYRGDIPFAIFIKNFFSKEKKFGSSDRKQINTLCYYYFRTGHLFNRQLNTDTLLAATFICSNETIPLISNLKPEWNDQIKYSENEKLAFLNIHATVTDIFPFKKQLNEKINFEAFCHSFVIQPALFIRVRPGHKTNVLKKLSTASIPFKEAGENCLQFSPGVNIENYLKLDEEFVIQDYNSQLVFSYLNHPKNKIQSTTDLCVWDCCAASGGKSILLHDILNKKVELTASDIRPSIIANLKQRFERAYIKNYTCFIADLSKPLKLPGNPAFDIIVCDAPCTGSGTWSRTPEQLYYFNTGSIEDFSKLQKNIVTNAVPYLKKEGLFIYITCSLFKKENEEIANYIEQELQLQLLEIKNIWGYQQKADSMFVAVFKKV